MPAWKEKYTGFENTSIAVMGCIVNGIGEAKNADIGIFIPGDFEKPQLQIYVKGKQYMTLQGEDMAQVGQTFLAEIEKYLSAHY